MEYKKLGLSDLRVSAVGFGACAIGGHDYGSVDDEESVQTILEAISTGITFFDTADVYGFGHSEEILGKALQRTSCDGVVVSTKFGVGWNETGKTFRDCSPGYVKRALDASLRRLQLDCIPLYQLHWHDGKTPLEDVFGTLDQCRLAGKIQCYGCSNVDMELLRQSSQRFDIQSVQVPFSLADSSFADYLAEAVNQLNMGSIVYNVLGRGVLTGKFRVNQTFLGTDTRKHHAFFEEQRFAGLSRLVDALRRIGQQYGKTPAQVAIRWVLDTPAVTTALVGIRNRVQLRENADVCTWKLEAGDYAFLSELTQTLQNGERQNEREYQS